MPHTSDILLVTVTKVESLAVLEAFKRHTAQEARIESRGGRTFHDLGTANGCRVWMGRSEMGAGGLGGSLQSVAKAIDVIKPSAVIMVGIAFGMNEQKQAIGDILVSENLRLYELQRVGADATGEKKIILRGARPDSSRWLLDAFKNADLHWRGAVVRLGTILSGEKLVDNIDFCGQLAAFEPEAIGGEMEGAGLYAACQEARVDWLLVKAICDWADGRKDLDKKARQELAARNAAEFVLHVIKTVSLAAEAKAAHGESDAPHGAIQVMQTGSGSLAVGQGNVTAGAGGIAIGGNVIKKSSN